MPSIDVADAFLTIYRELRPQVCLNRAYAWRVTTEFDDLAREVSQAARAGRYEGIVSEPADSETGQQERLAHLTGLDWAFKDVNPMTRGSGAPVGLRAIRERHARDGRFNSDPDDGLLLAKLTVDVRGVAVQDRMPDLFSAVVVAPAPGERVEFELAPRDAHLSGGERRAGLRVACMPMLEDDRELDFDTRHHDGLLWYRVEPKGAAEPGLGVRIAKVVDAAAADACLLTVAPEVSCSDELLKNWAENARRAVVADAPLRWVFAGTGNIPGPGPSTNTGHLLDATTGEVLLRQDKQFRFNIDARLQTGNYPLPGLTGAERAHEDIQIAVVTTVLELGCARVAILVCEDLGRAESLLADLYAHGVSHIIAPVFSKETLPNFWEQAAAKNYTNAYGATVIVANSLVLTRLAGKTGEAGAALVHGPQGGIVQTASAPDELIRYVLHDTRALEALDKPLSP
jgi:predicted amidohydrolase